MKSLRLKSDVVNGQRTILKRSSTGELAAFGLNSSAEMIWKLIQEGKDETEIIETLRKQYGGNRQTITKDVKTFLKLLAKRGLVEEVEE